MNIGGRRYDLRIFSVFFFFQIGGEDEETISGEDEDAISGGELDPDDTKLEVLENYFWYREGGRISFAASSIERYPCRFEVLEN